MSGRWGAAAGGALFGRYVFNDEMKRSSKKMDEEWQWAIRAFGFDMSGLTHERPAGANERGIPHWRDRCPLCENKPTRHLSLFDVQERLFKIQRGLILLNISLEMEPEVRRRIDIALAHERSKSIRRKSVGGLRHRVLKRDGYRCVFCGSSPDDGETVLHVDHIVPVSHGGENVISNLRTLCRKCNLSRSNAA